MSTMTSKERVKCSLAWKEPDRVPIQTYLTPEIHELLAKHFAPRSVTEVLGVDFRGVSARFLGPIKPSHDGLWYDEWGVGYKMFDNGRGGTYPEAFELPLAKLETMDDVAAYPWPDPAAHDFSKIEEQCDAIKDFAVCCGGAGTPDILNGVSHGRGMERVMIDITTRDEVGLAIIAKRINFEHEIARRTLEAGRGKIDILCLGEDMGNQNGRMFSPKDFHEVFRPALQRFIDLAHRHGAKAMLHCCGDSHEIMPDLMDMGLDILDAMQPEPKGMNPEKIRALCKGRLAFCGLISTQKTLPFGTVEECRREARHRLDVIAKGGGYIFAPAHCIQAGTPLENILAIYEEALGARLS